MNEVILARLNIIAAKATILAENYKNGKMWDGDLSRGIDSLEEQIRHLKNESGCGYFGPG